MHFQRKRTSLATLIAVCVLIAGCGDKEDHAHSKPATKPPAKVAEKGDGHGKEEGAIKMTDEEVKLAGIRVETVTEQDVADVLVVTATIQPNQDRLAHLAPRVPGRVIKVNAGLGDRVGAGQSLASLDSIEAGEARSAHIQAESEAQVAKGNLDRAERLQAEQIVSQKDYLRARAEHDKARAALRAARDKVEMLGIGAADGEKVSVFPLTAPFAGTVIEKKAVVGELAQPDTPLFTVADLSVVWIEANLMEKDLSRLKVGSSATVTVPAYGDERFTGKLTYIGGTLDKETRTIRGRIEVKNTDGRLKPEMFATAAIQTARTGKAILLPDEAVALIGGQPTVFIEEHGFEPRVVQLGERLQGRVVIKSGLKPDDLVVVAGTYALKARALKSQIGEGHAH